MAASSASRRSPAASQMLQRRSLIFLMSDFISAPGWDRPLAHLSRRHEVVAARLHDPAELELPDFGMAVMQDAETGEQLWVDAHDRGFRRRYAEAAERRETAIRAALSNAGVDTLELSTSDDLMETLLRKAGIEPGC